MHSKLSNFQFSMHFIIQTFTKSYLLKSLISVPGTLVNIILKVINCFYFLKMHRINTMLTHSNNCTVYIRVLLTSYSMSIC